MKALDEVRAGLDKENKVAGNDFRVTTLGGESTLAATGKPFDFLCARPRGITARDFMRRHFENSSFRANYWTYGGHICGVLCRSWAHKAQWYYNEEKKSFLGPATIFRPQHHERYQEPEEMTELMSRPDLSDAARARGEEIRQLSVIE